MGEVRPPSSDGAHSGGVVLGVVLGLIVAVTASFMLVMTFSDAPQGQSCLAGTATGIALLAVAALLAWLAWFAIRRKGSSFGLGLFRGIACTLAIFFLIPWPCGLTYYGAGSIIDACHAHTTTTST
ncbi:MAG TPA: hypothetical protein VHT05_14770 [Candidatus Elarobacter sp.]|jgi:high-affinity Fe2+/Pb2+ permease|nr:hypothetical protein [Candidatus Elarobacter sp.]